MRDRYGRQLAAEAGAQEATTAPGEGVLGKYPWLFPPPGFITVDRNNQLSPVVPVGVEQLCETIQITSLYEGWLTMLGVAASDWSALTFTIYQGGAPLRDYMARSQPIGAPETPKPVFIPLLPNYPLELRCTSSGATSFRWSLFGWYYPTKGR